MAISLLHPPDKNADAESVSVKMLRNLSIDRSFAGICTDLGSREYFLSVISAPTDDVNEILYRQEILKDLERFPDLLERLISLTKRFDELRASQKNSGKLDYRIRAEGSSSSDSAKNILQTKALCLKRSLMFVKSYADLLKDADIKSRGLQTLYNTCRDISENAEFAQLSAFCKKYEYFSTSGAINFGFSADESGVIVKIGLVDGKYIRVTDPEIKKGFSLFKKAPETVYPCVRLDPITDDSYDKLASRAISSLSDLFGEIYGQIFEMLGLLGEELSFYKTAVRYINLLHEKGAALCYPTFDDHGVSVKNLYDLYLLVTKPSAADVVPNDFLLTRDGGGLVVFGSNGSGKTVYLRSVGCMLILAQAGLPVPCESASLTPFSCFAAQFSEAEKEFCAGNEAGRFEQEVRELAEMVDGLKEGALVFLNETFQSTAYAEGADGLYDLLEYFTDRSIRWILVTHLTALEDRFDKDKVTVLKTTAGFKVSV